MGLKFEESEAAMLRELNASFRFAITGASFEEDERTGRVKQVATGYVTCDFVDNSTGELYASARGIDEPTAFRNALAAAIKAEKPMTPAQRAHMAMNGDSTAKDAEIARLKAELAAAKGEAPPAADKPPAKSKSIRASGRIMGGDIEKVATPPLR